MSGYMRWYPFAAVTGQEQAKRAICITLVNPKAGSLLISGVTGTAKSVLVRGAAELSGDRKLFPEENIAQNIALSLGSHSVISDLLCMPGVPRYSLPG